MPIERYFKLYLNAGRNVPQPINVNQYDSGETWYFSLFTDNGTAYFPSTGAIIGIKADGHVIDNAATVDNRGRVVVTETEQMTAAPGKAVFELSIDDNSHGTANFIVLVEPKPSENGILSDSDLSLLQEAIDSTNPAAIAEGVSDWMDEHLTPTTPVVDDTLTVQGAAADAKATGDAIAALETQIEQSVGLTDDVKEALLQIARKVVYIDADGQEYYDDLYDALYPPIPATAISLSDSAISWTTTGQTKQLTATLTPADATDTVTWSSSNTSVATVSSSGLVTGIALGSATITATAGSVSATCSVLIAAATVTSISASYTQSGTVYSDDSLDVLKSDLVVTATWSDQTTSVVSSDDYTLSGTLTEGTSTITVAYAGKSTTFNVTVSAPKFAVAFHGNFTTNTPMDARYTLITSGITLTSGQTLTLTVNSGYKFFHVASYGTGGNSALNRTAKASNKIYVDATGVVNGNTKVYSTSEYVCSTDASGVAVVCSSSSWVNGAGTVTFTPRTAGGVSEVTFGGIGFYVEKISGASITEDEAKSAVSWVIS